MGKILPQDIASLTYVEKEQLLAALKAAIAEELASRPAEDPARCPRCGCPEFVRKGRGRDGSQRWLCRGCARTFSAATGGLLSRSKLPASAWMEFAACMADMLPLRETASRCGVSLYTAWFMRMRACEVMSHRLAPPREGTFHVDGTYVVSSLKGNHGRSGWFDMPRRPHRNGQDGRRGNRAKSRERACVVCGANELGDSFSVVACEGVARGTDVGLIVRDHVPPASAVVTDGHLSYGALDGRFASVVAVDPSDPSTGHINLVNSLHSRLKDFLRRMRGVSTRRLQRYLDWFSYMEQLRRGDSDRRRVLFDDETRGRYFLTRELTHLEARGTGLYWNRRIWRERDRKSLGLTGLPLDDAMSTLV